MIKYRVSRAMAKMCSLDKKKASEHIALFFLHTFLTLCKALPLSSARKVGASIANLVYRFNGRTRLVTERNLQLVFPNMTDLQNRNLCRESFQEKGKLAAEMGHIWMKPWVKIQNIVETQNIEFVSDSLKSGHGVIVLVPHLGNWEVMGLYLATLGDLVALYKPLRLKEIDTFVYESRQRTGAKLVPTDRRGVAKILRSIRSGGITAILPDQVPDHDNAGMNVPFFGIECSTATLAYNLTKRSDAKVVAGAALRTDGGFRLVFYELGAAMYGEDPREALETINAAVEYLIVGHEAQYQWEYKRFKCRPPGPIDHYRF